MRLEWGSSSKSGMLTGRFGWFSKNKTGRGKAWSSGNKRGSGLMNGGCSQKGLLLSYRCSTGISRRFSPDRMSAVVEYSRCSMRWRWRRYGLRMLVPLHPLLPQPQRHLLRKTDSDVANLQMMVVVARGPCWRRVERTAQHHMGRLFRECGRWRKGRMGDAAWNVDTTPTCTRADAHFSRAHITVHNSHIDPHFSNVVTSTLAQVKRNRCRAFLQNHFHLIVMSLLNVLFVRFLLSLHRLLDLCHDPQRHRPRWKGAD